MCDGPAIILGWPELTSMLSCDGSRKSPSTSRSWSSGALSRIWVGVINCNLLVWWHSYFVCEIVMMVYGMFVGGHGFPCVGSHGHSWTVVVMCVGVVFIHVWAIIVCGFL